MQRADHLEVQPMRFFEQGLHLRTIFADDIAVIAAGFIHILVLKIHLVGKNRTVEGPEGAERVCGEQRSGRLVVGYHDLRPMHHRREEEFQLVVSGGERVVFLDHKGFAA